MKKAKASQVHLRELAQVCTRKTADTVDVGMRITHALPEALDRRMGLGSAVQAVYQAPHSIQFWQKYIRQEREEEKEGRKNILL